MVYTGPIDDIDALVAICQFSPDAYVLVEQAPRHVVTGEKERQNLLLFIRLEKLKSEQYEGIRLSNYTSGRVFDQNAEIRWERMEQTEQQEGKFQAVYVGPEREQFPFKKDKEQSEKLGKSGNPRTTHYFLFGERLKPEDINTIGPPTQPGDFAQLRIPRILRYPSPRKGQNASRLQLVVSEYVDEDTGKVQLFRFRDLEPEE
ncbi:MAG: type III-D CRISPR-associated protein Csx19 [Ktedonobacteraceae bacterium]